MPVLGVSLLAYGQHSAASLPGVRVALTVRSDSGQSVANAKVTILEPGSAPVSVWTDYAGRCRYVLRQSGAYRLQISASGFYPATQSEDSSNRSLQVALVRKQLIEQQVRVRASPAGINPQQSSDAFSLGTAAIVNIPYPVSRDIRTLLPFIPGVIADGSGQIHVVGSEYWQTLYTLDGFDIRSPVSGELALRVSADAVRSIRAQTTRYPVQYGRSTGGVVAFSTGMGDNRFRFNATNFLPSYHDLNGLRFDKIVPRFTFSGPLVRNHAWFLDGLETEYDNIYIPELPAGANTDELIRGSNLLKFQANLSRANSLTAALLYNGYHSPYDGISTLVPQQSTTKRDTTAWFPYIRDQQQLPDGALLRAGFGLLEFRDGFEPHGDSPYTLTPETAKGSYFQNALGTSRRAEGNVTLFLPRRHWLGTHDIRGGIDLDHINFGERVSNAPVNYLREDGTLLRRSTFSAAPPFTRHNVELGAYLEDRWNTSLLPGLLINPGLRFDWDEILRRPLLSPRLALVYAPGAQPNTKISAGVGVYYEHTQLAYLEDALTGSRSDTYYDADGITPSGPPQLTTFSYNPGTLHEARAINWSIGVEQKLPSSIYAKASFIDKNISGLFTYVNQSGPAALSGNYLLTSNRRDHDDAIEVEARRTFGRGYTLFGSYVHSIARTNAAIDYSPGVSLLGAQQSGPLAWNTPNRVLSWGWLPFDLPFFRKNWDFVYSFDWRSGIPITSVNVNQQVVGRVGSHSFPNYVSFSPGLEWRFHIHGYYFGLRGMMVNATDSQNPTVVNNNVDSPDYMMFTEPLGRALTARIRLIQSKR